MPETFEGYVIATAPNADQFEAVVNDLELEGFDRAQFSALSSDEDHEPDAVETAEDRQQIRVLGTSMGATAAGLAGAGVVAAATGGMALPAIAVGVTAAGGVAALSEAIGIKHEKEHADWMAQQATEGGIVMHIAVTDDKQRQQALAAARKHCGSAVFCDQDRS